MSLKLTTLHPLYKHMKVNFQRNGTKKAIIGMYNINKKDT